MVGRKVIRDPEVATFLSYITFELCGLNQVIGCKDATAAAQNIGRHNVGVEIEEMLREESHGN